MDTQMIEKRFSEMGARVKVRTPDLLPGPTNRFSRRPSVRRAFRAAQNEHASRVSLNVLRDRKGEFFTVSGPVDARVEIVDVRPKDRHLLLFTEQDGVKAKFLCGHDERHWFVAAVPEYAAATNVVAAKEALMPDRLRPRLSGVKRKKRLRRRNEVFVRQGEWFFVPEDPPDFDERMVLRNEPLSRGRGKPHILEFAFRFGGTSVYIGASGTVTPDEWAALSKERRRDYPRLMTRDPNLYAKGKVSHPDHATITLNGWHRVEMNTEQRAAAMRSVMFLD